MEVTLETSDCTLMCDGDQPSRAKRALVSRDPKEATLVIHFRDETDERLS